MNRPRPKFLGDGGSVIEHGEPDAEASREDALVGTPEREKEILQPEEPSAETDGSTESS